MDLSPNVETALRPARRNASPAACGVCGDPVRHGATCRACAVRLVDLALSSTAEEPGAEPDPRDLPDIAGLDYGHYQVCRAADGAPWELGRGSMGITYKAVDNNLGCLVALKVLNTEHFRGPRARERLLREARAAASLRHPNIAGIFHLGQDADRCFYAMEFIEGETLEALLLRQGRMEPAAALRIVLQAARALYAAHARGFVHRDIKPTNLMLVGGDPADSSEPTVKLIDFGLVKAADQSQGDAIPQAYFAGTPHYASPEQLLHGRADARADIYSLGRCLWHMLAGSAPVGSLFSSVVSTAKTSAAIQPVLESAPAAVTSLVGAMTAEDPAARPQTAAELIERVQTCLRGLEAGKAVPSARWKRPGKAVHPGWLALPVLALACWAAWMGLVRSGAVRSPSSGRPVSGISPQVRLLYTEAEAAYEKRTRAENTHAIDLYNRAIAQAPGFADAYAGLALAYYQTVFRLDRQPGNIDLAVSNAERAMALAPDSPKGYHAMGTIRSSQQRPWQSLEYLHKALERDPDYLPAMDAFGLMWIWVGKPQFCLPWVEAAARKQPTNLGVWYSAAEAHTEIHEDEQAEADYRRCLEINPNRVQPYCGLIHLCTLHEDYAKARELCTIALSVDSTSLYLQTVCVQVSFFSGDRVAAEAGYRELLKRDRTGLPTFHGGISYLSALGLLRCQAGDRAEGEALLEEASHLHSQDNEGPQAFYDLAGIRAAQGRKEEALALLRQAIHSGWTDGRSTRLDPRFAVLREEPAFQALLQGLRQWAADARRETERLCAKPLRLADYPVRSDLN